MATEGILLFLEFSLYNNSFLSSERELRIKHRKKMERVIIVLILMNYIIKGIRKNYFLK